MYVREGNRIYSTDFELKDLHVFYQLGVGNSIVEIINCGAQRAMNNRWGTPGNPAGSNMALVEVYIDELYVKNGTIQVR